MQFKREQWEKEKAFMEAQKASGRLDELHRKAFSGELPIQSIAKIANDAAQEED